MRSPLYRAPLGAVITLISARVVFASPTGPSIAEGLPSFDDSTPGILEAGSNLRTPGGSIREVQVEHALDEPAQAVILSARRS